MTSNLQQLGLQSIAEYTNIIGGDPVSRLVCLGRVTMLSAQLGEFKKDLISPSSAYAPVNLNEWSQFNYLITCAYHKMEIACR